MKIFMKKISLFLVWICVWGIAPLANSQDAEDDQKFYTNTYKVPVTSLTDRSRGKSDDPFSGNRKTLRESLEDVGINFPPGASCSSGGRTSQIIIRNTQAELDKVEAFLDELHRKNTPKQILVFIEYIEVESNLYNDWMFENRMTGDGTALRKQAQKWIKSGEGTLIDAVGVTARSGQRAKTESISETIYPTEPGVPEIPNEVDLEGANSKAPIARGVPSAFETRNVGTTLEVDPVLGADNWTLDLNMAPEIVALTGYDHWPPENELPMFTVSMPRFYTMKFTTQIVTLRGRYTFIGTARPHKPAVEGRKKPIVLTFVRADVGGVALPKTSDVIEPK